MRLRTHREPNRWDKTSFTERLNAPGQGTAADILKLALARLWEKRDEHSGAVPILSVHDEIDRCPGPAPSAATTAATITYRWGKR
jgi:DNA polymerase I-like protein with 3'-5' exonuclease and polymerase domains